MSRVAIYARARETGLPVAWSPARRRKHVGNHRACCVIDPRCAGHRVIAYRPRESHVFFSHPLNIADAIIIAGIAESSAVECKWEFITGYILARTLLAPDIFRSSSLLALCISLSVHPPNSRYSKWVVACRVPSCTASHAPFYWNTIFPFTDGLSEIAGKFFTSGRHESYNSTFQRGPPFGRMGMSRYENEEQCAIARGRGVFSAACDFANATPIARWWTRICENVASIICRLVDREKKVLLIFDNFLNFAKLFSASLVARDI